MIPFRSLLMIIPIMFYYLIESFFIGLFVSVAWKFILQPQFDIQLSYLSWVIIIWIVKVILFDPIKIAAALKNQIVLKNNDENVQTDES